MRFYLLFPPTTVRALDRLTSQVQPKHGGSPNELWTDDKAGDSEEEARELLRLFNPWPSEA